MKSSIIQTKYCLKGVYAICVEYQSRQNIISSTKRTKSKTTLTHQERVEGCQFGMDSHADVSCAGTRHARIKEVVEGQSCTVRPFNDSYKPMKDIKIVNVAFALDSDRGAT